MTSALVGYQSVSASRNIKSILAAYQQILSSMPREEFFGFLQNREGSPVTSTSDPHLKAVQQIWKMVASEGDNILQAKISEIENHLRDLFDRENKLRLQAERTHFGDPIEIELSADGPGYQLKSIQSFYSRDRALAISYLSPSMHGNELNVIPVQEFYLSKERESKFEPKHKHNLVAGRGHPEFQTGFGPSFFSYITGDNSHEPILQIVMTENFINSHKTVAETLVQTFELAKVLDSSLDVSGSFPNKVLKIIEGPIFFEERMVRLVVQIDRWVSDEGKYVTDPQRFILDCDLKTKSMSLRKYIPFHPKTFLSVQYLDCDGRGYLYVMDTSAPNIDLTLLQQYLSRVDINGSNLEAVASSQAGRFVLLSKVGALLEPPRIVDLADPSKPRILTYFLPKEIHPQPHGFYISNKGDFLFAAGAQWYVTKIGGLKSKIKVIGKGEGGTLWASFDSAEDYFYFVTQDHMLHCIDTETGELVFQERLLLLEGEKIQTYIPAQNTLVVANPDNPVVRLIPIVGPSK
jgi:hypothetical protein